MHLRLARLLCCRLQSSTSSCKQALRFGGLRWSVPRTPFCDADAKTCWISILLVACYAPERRPLGVLLQWLLACCIDFLGPKKSRCKVLIQMTVQIAVLCLCSFAAQVKLPVCLWRAPCCKPFYINRFPHLCKRRVGQGS